MASDYLNNLWMRPSADLMIAMSSKRPSILQRVVDAQSSANILQQLEARRAQRYGDSEESSSYSSCSTLECVSDEVPLAGDSFSIGSDDESFETDDSRDNDVLDSLKRKLKTLYRERMKAGAEQLGKWSLATLDNELFRIVKSVRQREKDLIDLQLQPLVQFINRFVEEVNAENGYKLVKKYREERLEKIACAIDNAEQSFNMATELTEKHIKNSYLFKSMETKSLLLNEYQMKLRDDTDKIKKRYQLEMDTFLKDSMERMEEVRKKYESMNSDLDRLEETVIREEVERVRRAHYLAQQQNKVNKLKAMEHNCCEEAGWLFVLDKLIKDIETFKKSFGHRQDLVKFLKRKLTLISKKKPSMDETSVASDKGVELETKSASSLTCPSFQDDEIHRILLTEAAAMLNAIVSNLPY